MSLSTEWDAGAYHRLADPQFEWGRRLLDDLVLRGDEAVIDAGCGTGRLSRLLLERLPSGRLTAVDLSQRMLEAARENLEPDFSGRVEYLRLDLLDLDLREAADLVFSTATFHWIADHSRLFRNLARALRAGGRLVAQFGGKGNLHRARSQARRVLDEPPFRTFFEGWSGPWNYPDAEVTAARLRQAGFEEVRTRLFPEPTSFPDADSFRQFVSTVVFRVHLQRITDPRLRQEFLDRCVAAAGGDDPPYTLDYWRLNASGRKPERPGEALRPERGR